MTPLRIIAACLGILTAFWFCGGDRPTLAPAYVTAADRTWDRLADVRVIDGDTIEADLLLGRGVVLKRRRIRLAGFDAWEMTRRRRTVSITDEELAKGKVARAAMETLIGDSIVQCLTEGDRDAYGRTVGRLRLIQRDGNVLQAENWMRERGHDRGGAP